MNVVSGEYGDRPKVWSKARMFAPEGKKLIVDVLEHCTFADIGAVALDWSNVLQRQPDEIAKPVLIIQTVKFVADKSLQVEVRLDVDDVFGQDDIMAEDIVRIIRQMEQKTLEEMEKYRELCD